MVPDKRELAANMKQNRHIHIAAFHLVRQGYIEIELENGNKDVVRKNELVICFSGMAHILSQGKSKHVCSLL